MDWTTEFSTEWQNSFTCLWISCYKVGFFFPPINSTMTIFLDKGTEQNKVLNSSLGVRVFHYHFYKSTKLVNFWQSFGVTRRRHYIQSSGNNPTRKFHLFSSSGVWTTQQKHFNLAVQVTCLAATSYPAFLCCAVMAQGGEGKQSVEFQVPAKICGLEALSCRQSLLNWSHCIIEEDITVS